MLRAIAAILMAGAAGLAAWSALGGPAFGGWPFGALVLAGLLWLVDGMLDDRTEASPGGAGDEPGPGARATGDGGEPD
jgi:hypothetical protein